MINFVNEAAKLISMNSVALHGNEEITAYAQGLMSSVGFKTQLQPITHSLEGVSKRQFNVIGILGDPLVDSRTKKGLLLSSHLDTAPPGLAKAWTDTGGNPFRIAVKDDRIVGLGAASAKLDFLCKLKACERYKDRRLKMPIYLAGTAGAELGCLGARFLTKSMSLNPRYAIAGDPTGLGVVRAHKASALYQISVNYTQLERDAKGYNTRIEVRCFGRSAHGSYPSTGDNAILRALSVIKRIRDANFQLRLSNIQGGDSPNKVPDQAMAEFYIQNSTFDDFKKFYRESLSQQDPQEAENMRVEFGGLGETGVTFLSESVIDAVAAVERYFASLGGSSLAAEDPSFDEPKSTVNFSGISQRPGAVDLLMDVRLLPSINIDGFESALKEGVQALNASYPNLMFRVSRQRYTPALDLPAGAGFAAVAEECSRGLSPEGARSALSISSEAALYSAAGYEAVAFGPAEASGNSHSPNEHVTVDHLDRAVHFYDRLIERFCL